MELAELFRDMLIIISVATVAVHLSLVAFSWFKRAAAEV